MFGRTDVPCEWKGHAAIDRAVEEALHYNRPDITPQAIQLALSKRDAEWREAARQECDKRGAAGHRQGYKCPACRTVARMEGK